MMKNQTNNIPCTTLQIALIASLLKKNKINAPRRFDYSYSEAERLITSLSPTIKHV